MHVLFSDVGFRLDKCLNFTLGHRISGLNVTMDGISLNSYWGSFNAAIDYGSGSGRASAVKHFVDTVCYIVISIICIFQLKIV